MTASPRVLGMLPGGVAQREPWPSEEEFFRSRPDITGLAAEDGMVVLNPFSGLTHQQKATVALNEAARVFMGREQIVPEFDLTPAQDAAFAGYGPPSAVRATIAARLFSGDPSAQVATVEQIAFVFSLAQKMRVTWNGHWVENPLTPRLRRAI